jgi:hypothetical protein
LGTEGKQVFRKINFDYSEVPPLHGITSASE